MDNLVRGVASKAKLIGLILLFAATAFVLVLDAAGIGGGFMPVIGSLILLVVDLAMVGIIPLLIALKKHDLVKYAFAPVFGYWIISTLFNRIGRADWITSGTNGIVITASLFDFIAGCALLAVIVMAVLFFITKKSKMLQIGFCILAGALVFFFLAWVMWIAAYAKFDADWTSYFGAFYNYLFFPFGLAFVALDLLMGSGTVGKQAVTETNEAEEEAPAQEETDEAEQEDIAVEANADEE